MIARDARRIAVVGFPDAQLLDICGPLEVFSRASRVISDEGRRRPEVYAVELLAHRAGPVRTSSGLAVVAARSFKSVRDGLDTLLYYPKTRVVSDRRYVDNGKVPPRASRRESMALCIW